MKYLILVAVLFLSGCNTEELDSKVITSIYEVCDKNDGLRSVKIWTNFLWGPPQPARVQADCKDGAEFNYDFKTGEEDE